MTNVFLVRHGQAQTGAVDEESYDSLSELGHQQAAWLGEHFAGSGFKVSRVIAGNLRRQQETAGHIAKALGLEVDMDIRLREIDYFGLAASMQERFNTKVPESRDEFLSHFPAVMAAWADGDISTDVETFQDYEERVSGVLDWAESHPGTMLVTSGGIIGMTVRHVLGLSLNSFSHVLLQIHNASVHQYQIEAGARRLVSFNGTPHLDPANRSDARTFI